MKILVLGGTQFIGHHFVTEAVRCGHQVSVFHRGTHGTGLFPGVEDIIGDRNGGLTELANGRWDAVVDTSAYFPKQVESAVGTLKDRCGRYLLISTVSVYEPSQVHKTETAPLKPIGDPNADQVTGETYGYLKVLCEQALEAAFGERSTIVRPGLVAGPLDPTNRFPYWTVRFSRPVGENGEVLVPDVLSSPLQQIDARDLAHLTAELLEKGLAGAFNAAGPTGTFGDMIEACNALNPGAKCVYASPEKLEELGVALWSDLPLSMGADDAGTLLADSSKAIAAGLVYRPFSETVQATAAWAVALEDSKPLPFRFTREREAAALAALRS